MAIHEYFRIMCIPFSGVSFHSSFVARHHTHTTKMNLSGREWASIAKTDGEMRRIETFPVSARRKIGQ